MVLILINITMTKFVFFEISLDSIKRMTKTKLKERKTSVLTNDEIKYVNSFKYIIIIDSNIYNLP